MDQTKGHIDEKFKFRHGQKETTVLTSNQWPTGRGSVRICRGGDRGRARRHGDFSAGTSIHSGPMFFYRLMNVTCTIQQRIFVLLYSQRGFCFLKGEGFSPRNQSNVVKKIADSTLCVLLGFYLTI